MRKYLAIAAACALTLGVVSFAGADESVQTQEAKIKPTKLPKKKPINIAYRNTITTFNEPGQGQPKSGVRTILDLPKQFKINNRRVPNCRANAAGLEGAATTDDAKRMCGKRSQVSADRGSSAQVTVAGLPQPIDVDVVAFNEDRNKLLLYSKPTGDASGIPASILVGKLKKFNKVPNRPREARRGKRLHRQSLDVRIPPLAAGAISFFEVTIPRSKYIQARCKPRRMRWQATTFFDDGTSTTDADMQRCKPRGGKRRR